MQTVGKSSCYGLLFDALLYPIPTKIEGNCDCLQSACGFTIEKIPQSKEVDMKDWALESLRLILGFGFLYHGFPKIFSAEEHQDWLR